MKRLVAECLFLIAVAMVFLLALLEIIFCYQGGGLVVADYIEHTRENVFTLLSSLYI